MPRANQRSGGIPTPDTREEPRHGCGCGRCSPQVQNVDVKIVGSQASGDIADGKHVNEGKRSTGESQIDHLMFGMSVSNGFCILRLCNL